MNTETVLVALVYLVLCIAGYAAFCIFYAREEGTSAAIVKAVVMFVVASLLAIYLRLLGAAVVIAATFYVADRKNRSRGWAALAFLLGPIALLIAVALPKLPDSSLSLSLTGDRDQGQGAAQGR
jgi:hypothetical protein